ncbi:MULTISPECIES: PP2C family protein-serine/threonine phosphatase [Streptomycetaceae]|uniref:Protein serine/threonine phosphatase n=1 Tax=Streptantibioticus cattleyicolor (strain ATCC 35852 / DSM 46488 / JCM 4925 / NBRC 14057 / NRRL 8057) TaxID=1003195 RepID=F8K476_STREN|nr:MULTISPECIES: PP2C family protein-serine/threonine phosphatase [Streptomycetaceae]AEW92625.1 protein serine/threonine phosphatase [Streptantibioticus cattleyicolor NRRL 8057 = DSM 46488]MYS57404.1 SpoIIE family protein phosphatase [Streptomyces sp. SID5468]CCB72978.1 Serine phosphatase RsbU, regulator of sigma subunit [Streptantibioticus cattleyicolor NRRL 8057 = DSM 46488]
MDGSRDVPGRVPPVRLSRRARVAVLGAYGVVAAAVVTDVLTGPRSTLSPLLAAVPVLASTGTRRVLVPLLAGAVSVLLVGALAVDNPDVATVVHATSAATVLAVTVTSAATVALVAARERELTDVRNVAEAAQRALLRPVASRIGRVRIAVRYRAAAAEARIGGDVYEAMTTPYGVRLLLGDVQGKGLPAVETAADVLGVYREAARAEPDLAVVAGRIDAALVRRPVCEDFVTAVLVTVPLDDAPVVVVNCGHPPPMLRRDGRVSEVEPPGHAPPLALLTLAGGGYRARPLALPDGGTLLLYTDGVSEARDAGGRFYPLAERLAALPAADPDALLDALLADVDRHTGGRLADDVAVLALCRTGRG